ncbi:MAG: substrate-binding domain-containing protein [Isosphaeraceae bacterium]
MRRFILHSLGWLAALYLGVSGCSPKASRSGPRPIILATTTSTQDSGLLDQLVPEFRKSSGIDVKVLAVGSGQALELGRRGDADVLLVHSPASEEKFVRDGLGLSRVPVMVNDFVILGPQSDPAQIRTIRSAAEAFRLIRNRRSPFVSRADDSGTHRMELSIWNTSDATPAGSWYLRAGTGMAQALRMASEKQAYILSDRGTYLSLRSALDLEILLEGDPVLRNSYHVIIVNPAIHPSINVEGARQFVGFLTSPRIQAMIGEFGKSRYGQPLFSPSAR